jgi:hypothetical protein
VTKTWDYLRDAGYIDQQTATLDIMLLTFTPRLRVFASWVLALIRNPDGTFTGSPILRQCFETTYDLTTSEGVYRSVLDMAMLVTGLLHFLWLMEEVTTLVARNKQRGVRIKDLPAFVTYPERCISDNQPSPRLAVPAKGPILCS